MAPYKLVRITLNAENGNSSREASIPPGVEITQREKNLLTLRVGRTEAPGITAQLLQSLPVVDLVVEDPPIEAVIDKVYTEGGL
jgi:viologen exporter family transport system ATP-binding protein